MHECPRLPGAVCLDAPESGCCLSLPDGRPILGSENAPADTYVVGLTANYGAIPARPEPFTAACVVDGSECDCRHEKDLAWCAEDEHVPSPDDPPTLDLLALLTIDDLFEELLARLDDECGDLSHESRLTRIAQELYEDR